MSCVCSSILFGHYICSSIRSATIHLPSLTSLSINIGLPRSADKSKLQQSGHLFLASHCSQLCTLKFFDTPAFTFGDLALHQLPSLTSLEVGGHKASDALLAIVASAPQLCEFRLGRIKVLSGRSDTVLRYVLATIAPMVVHLSILAMDPTESTIFTKLKSCSVYFDSCRTYRNLTQLTSLHLRALEEEDARPELRIVAKMCTSLTELTLSSPMDDFTCLPDIPSLTSLTWDFSVYNNRFEVFSALLSMSPQLRFLSLPLHWNLRAQHKMDLEEFLHKAEVAGVESLTLLLRYEAHKYERAAIEEITKKFLWMKTKCGLLWCLY